MLKSRYQSARELLIDLTNLKTELFGESPRDATTWFTELETTGMPVREALFP